VFYLDVTYVALPIHMLQEYVVNVSSVSDVCCSKCFRLQHERDKGAQAKVGPLGHNGPRVRAGSEAGMEYKGVSMGVATGIEHETASMGRQQVWSTRRSGAQSCIYRQATSAEHEVAFIGALMVSLLKTGGQQARVSERPGASLSLFSFESKRL
jgi:hypothetical protein